MNIKQRDHTEHSYNLFQMRTPLFRVKYKTKKEKVVIAGIVYTYCAEVFAMDIFDSCCFFFFILILNILAL